MKVPLDWRPLKIEDKHKEGLMLVGDSSRAIAQIKWWRPNPQSFEPDLWVKERIKETIPSKSSAVKGPAPDGFEPTVWLPDVKYTPDVRKSIWLGYARDANLTIEIIFDATLGKSVTKLYSSMILTSLEISGLDESTRWSVFDVSFESPPGFALIDKRLKVGDMMLRLRNAKRTLILRQVYPAKLALSRRPIERWLKDTFTKEHRRFYPSEPHVEWALKLPAKTLVGRKRHGKKQLAFPLGFCAPRFHCSAVVIDEELGRLLIAHADTLRNEGDEILTTSISSMNWARDSG